MQVIMGLAIGRTRHRAEGCVEELEMGMGWKVGAVCLAVCVVAASTAFSQTSDLAESRAGVVVHASQNDIHEYIPVNTQAPGEHPLSPEEATAKITLPDGFNVTLFAGEPHVRQPVAMNIDDRGRVWVAESYSYQEWKEKGEDRILIFEDTDHDGSFDLRKVFYTGASHLSGFAIGFGGVWICDSPNLEFIPDRDGDDIPDGPPEVVLDGFTTKASHNFFNGLKWGPDGWLHGRHGILAPSFIGAPGTPMEDRTEVDCGLFRIHPVTREFDVVVNGTTNPWGVDWNDMGEMFMTGNVNGHLWHVIPGAYYPRMSGQGLSLSQHVYDRIQYIPDHLHHVGAWNDARFNELGAHGPNDELGGGHSHCGGMIYLGDTFPPEYRDTMFMSNTHGRRINNDALVRKGSGYEAVHRPDFMFANHPWYRGVTQVYGPDGGVYASDWTDLGECHDSDGVHCTSGRIHKITYGNPDPISALNLAAESNRALVQYQLHKNEWFVRHARRILQERYASGRDLSAARQELRNLLNAPGQPVDRQLRMIWALHCTGGLGQGELTTLLAHPNEHIRSWAVRLIAESGSPTEDQFRLIRTMASDGESKLVRLYIASSFPRFEESQQWIVAEDLVSDFGYEDDQNLPQMIGFSLVPLVAQNPERGVALLDTCNDPMVYKNIVRRIASDFDLNAALMPKLVAAIAKTVDNNQITLTEAGVTGIEQALHGLKGIDAPINWNLLANSDSQEVRSMASELDSVFADQSTMTKEDWVSLLGDATRRNQAIRELAAYDDEDIAKRLLRGYRRYGKMDRSAAIGTLSSRVSLARPLLQAMTEGSLDPSEVSAFYARQIYNLGDDQLNKQLESVWGNISRSSEQIVAAIQSWQNALTPTVLAQADLENGRALFQQTCAPCHALFGEGRSLAPDLTGSDRKNLYYLLENIMDPNALVPRDYRMTVLTLKDGRMLSGTIAQRSRHAVTLVGLAQEDVIPLSDIEVEEQSELSAMPEGLLETLTENEVRDLLAYIQQ
jgi:putative membrane-bound dehydrogenase-like protein